MTISSEPAPTKPCDQTREIGLDAYDLLTAGGGVEAPSCEGANLEWLMDRIMATETAPEATAASTAHPTAHSTAETGT